MRGVITLPTYRQPDIGRHGRPPHHHQLHHKQDEAAHKVDDSDPHDVAEQHAESLRQCANKKQHVKRSPHNWCPSTPLCREANDFQDALHMHMAQA